MRTLAIRSPIRFSSASPVATIGGVSRDPTRSRALCGLAFAHFLHDPPGDACAPFRMHQVGARLVPLIQPSLALTRSKFRSTITHRYCLTARATKYPREDGM